MTNAEAIRWLQLDIEMMKFDPSTGEEAYLNDDAKKTLEALDMAIAALEPKKGDSGSVSCMNAENMHDRTTDDYISKAAAQEEIARRDTTDGTVKVFSGREVYEILANLPSAQPERKKGRWKLIEDIDMRKKGFLDGLYASVAWMNYECSCCGHIVHNSLRGREENRTSFCPNCGSYNGGNQHGNE